MSLDELFNLQGVTQHSFTCGGHSTLQGSPGYSTVSAAATWHPVFQVQEIDKVTLVSVRDHSRPGPREGRTLAVLVIRQDQARQTTQIESMGTIPGLQGLGDTHPRFVRY